MLKKIIMLASVLAVSAGSLFAQATKTAVVNMDNVLNSFSETPAVLANLQADARLLQDTEKDFVEQLRKKQEEYKTLIGEINNPLNSDSVKEQKRQEAINLEQQVMKDRQDMQNALSKMQRELEERRATEFNKIYQKIKPYIQNYMKEHDIGILLNTSTRALVIEWTPEIDITDPINAILAKEFPPQEGAATTTTPTLTTGLPAAPDVITAPAAPATTTTPAPATSTTKATK